MQLVANSWESLLAAVRTGDRREFIKHFEACLGFELRPVHKFGAKQARAYILQKISDAAGPSGSNRDTAIEPRFRRMLLPYLVYRDFTEGRAIVQNLETLAEQLELSVTDSDYDAALMGGALAVFCDREDLLKRFGNLPPLTRSLDSYDRTVYEDCFAGFWAFLNNDPGVLAPLSRTTYFPGVPGTIIRPFEKFHLTHLRLPALELFTIAATNARPRNSHTLGDIIQSGDLSCGTFSNLLGSCYDHLDRNFFSETAQLLKKLADDARGFFGIGPQTPPTHHAASYLNCALAAYAASKDGELPQGDTQKYIACAERSLAAGMPVLAATLAGIIRVDPAVLGRADKLLADIALKHSYRTPFRATPKRPKWENAFDEIERFLASSQLGDDAETGSTPGILYWQLNLEPIEAGTALYALDSVSARIRKPLKSGKLNKGKAVSVEAVLDGRADAETTLDDIAPLAVLRKNRYNVSRSSPFGYDSRMLELARALVGHPRLCVKCMDPEETLNDIALASHSPSLETTRNADGDLVLTLPLGAGGDSLAYLRKDADNAYSLTVPDKRFRTVAAMIRQYSADGYQLVIPASSAADAGRRVMDFARQIPVTGVISAEGDSADFTHLPVPALPHARISLAADDVMQIELRVAMGSGKDCRVALPGAGNAEIVARKDGVPVVYVRDLEEEEKSAEALSRLILAQGECEDLGEFAWAIPSLGDALAVLETLKNLDESVTVDWLDPNRALRLSTLDAVAIDARPKGIDHWLGLSGQCQLNDGRVIAFQDMLRALPARSGNYVRLNHGDFIRISDQLRGKLELISSAGEIQKEGLAICDAALPSIANVLSDNNATGECQITLPEILLRRADEIREELAREVHPPATLKAELRPYQLEGFTWLAHLASCGIGACLADDMGLGKTVEVISLLLERAPKGASLVIAPTSVCGNWESEIRRFAPALHPISFGQCATPAAAVAAAGAFDIVIASYGLVATRLEMLAGREWNGVVLDEAQAIKNHASKRAKAVKQLRAAFKVAATGTPVENRLSEFWSIFDFLNPGMLLSQEKFIAHYTTDGHATDKLKKLVSPLILRRLKKDVLLDLPEKTEINLDVVLGETEREAYEACRRMAIEHIENAKQAKSGQPGMTVLAELTKLRRFCCHPSLVLPEMTTSAKLEALAELLGNLNENGHRALVFSQYTDYLAIVRAMLEENGWSYQYLDGTTPSAERGEQVNAFQNGEGDFFLISLKAGGFGLNLTAANYVILLDPWWNPAVEKQAADRVHRIGQKQPVTVYRLIAKDTIEERVVALHNDKLEIADDLLEGTANSKLTTEEMISLFR